MMMAHSHKQEIITNWIEKHDITPADAEQMYADLYGDDYEEDEVDLDLVYYDCKKRHSRPEFDFAADWTYDDYLDMYAQGMRMLP